MGTQTAKQYLELQGKPILAYALEIFEQSAVVDDILLMTDKEHVEYCKKEICEKYGIKKVSTLFLCFFQNFLDKLSGPIFRPVFRPLKEPGQ